MTIDIEMVLKELARKRTVFHSEADFQHSLAWEIHNTYPECAIRLERSMHLMKDATHLDIFAYDEECLIMVEVKYKTRGLLATVQGEQFYLKDQSAQDLGRYDFLKDIERLEKLGEKYKSSLGYAVMLSNDSSYWKPPGNPNTCDSSFRINEGRVVSGELAWGARTSEGTKKDRDKKITVRGKYILQWHDYSELSSNETLAGNYRRFRYIVVKINTKHALENR
jgi:hypothetical protein